MKLKTKVVLLFSLVIFLGTLAMGSFAVYTLNVQIKEAARDKVQSDLALGHALIDEKFPGDWSVRGEALYKGDTKMEGNFDIVDLIGEKTGDTVTLFRGDMRVATNVKKDDGSRAVGTHVSAAVAQTTLKDGKTYIGEAVVVGTLSQTAYEPIKDKGGQIIGIWYVGVPNSMYDMIVAQFRTQVIWFGLGGLAVAILLSYFVAELNARPLMRLTQVAQQVADGDLSVEKLPTNRKDEIGMLATAVNFMVDNLRTLIQSINQTSAQVAASSDDLSASTEQATQASGQITETILMMANGAEDQLMRTRLSAEAIDALAEGLQRIAETSVLVTEASMQSAQEAEQGNESIQKAVSQMVQIHGTVQESVGGVKQLAARSQEVGKIVEVITGIAAQTNLLALNAAIEAARAGEQGKGFAVVADEVRKLAEQCGESAAQITELIQSIQREATRATGSMDEVVREVQSGADAVHVAGEAFQRILHSAKQVAGQIQDVTASAQEITANSEQVATSVEEVTRIAKDSADHAQTVAASSEEQSASIEEISASVESLSRMAHELQQMIRRFQV